MAQYRENLDTHRKTHVNHNIFLKVSLIRVHMFTSSYRNYENKRILGDEAYVIAIDSVNM